MDAAKKRKAKAKEAQKEKRRKRATVQAGTATPKKGGGAKEEEKDVLVQASITMAAKPSHKASSLQSAASEEMQKALRTDEVPKVKNLPTSTMNKD